MGSEVSFTNVITAAVEKELSPEELIQIVDTDKNCRMSKDELLDFLRKWADKKHVTLSHETENFAGHGFDFMDEYKNSGGQVDPESLKMGMDTAYYYRDMAGVAETAFGFFWATVLND